MRAETEVRIEQWETRPTDGGYAGLHALIETEFSGVVSTDGARLFVLKGHLIGLFGGPMESFANAPITAHVAPHPALPILFAMQERGGQTTTRCYTDDTPLADAAETLASNGFTGYVELSENVLSGEYYVVYHRSRSILAFVGGGDRLLVDDDARSRTNEEVGIYEVTAVTFEEFDPPAPPSPVQPTPPPSSILTGPTTRRLLMPIGRPSMGTSDSSAIPGSIRRTCGSAIDPSRRSWRSTSSTASSTG